MTTREADGSGLRSTGAVLAGVVAVLVLSVGTDTVFHMLKVYPPFGEPMWDPKLNLLALSYRCVYGVLGSYIAGRLAPRRPMKHAMIVAGIGFVLSVVGITFYFVKNIPGPAWLPIALVATALPGGWLGGLLASRKRA
jgi:hypothetical protein